MLCFALTTHHDNNDNDNDSDNDGDNDNNAIPRKALETRNNPSGVKKRHLRSEVMINSA